MTELVRITDEIFTIRGLCSQWECDQWIAHSESLGYEAATINTERGPRRIEKVRNTSRMIVDEPSWASDLWGRVESENPYAMKGWEAVGLNDRFRFHRYDAGQKFHWHADGSVRLDDGEKSLFLPEMWLSDT